VTVTGTTTLSALTASTALALNASKEVVSVTNTGTGNNVLSASPTLTGTIAGASMTLTGTLGVNGNTTLGDASTDTVQVNGYMGVGGAAVASRGVEVTSSALTGTGQRGISSTPTATSAATTGVIGVLGAGNTAAAAFTAGYSIALYAQNAVKGAGSTITNQYGVYVEDLTQGTNNYGITSAVSSGTNKWNIYASGTAANYFAGNVQLGSTTARSNLGAGATPRLQIEGTSTDTSFFSIVQNIASTSGGGIIGLGATRSTTVGGSAALTNGDRVGSLIGYGSDGTNLLSVGAVQFFVDGTPGTNDMPGRIVFSTTADGASSLTERLRIDSAGNVGIGTSSPGQLLDVSASVGASIQITSTKTGAATNDVLGNIYFYGSDASGPGVGVKSSITSTVQGSLGAGSDLRFATTDATGSNNTERLRIDSSGNVGIGTSSPGVLLQLTQTGANTYSASGSTALPAGGLFTIQNAQQASGVYRGLTFSGVNADGNNANAYIGAVTLASGNGMDMVFGTRTASTAYLERLRIDSSGRVLVGGTSSRAIDGGVNSLLQIEGLNTGASYPNASFIVNSAATSGAFAYFGKSRGTTLGSNTAVLANDNLGGIAGVGADGTDINNLATAIRFSVDGAVSTGIVPGRIVFETTNTSGTLTERARITSDGYVRLASGSLGIQFNGDTAAANALDDYEEGTFTPTIVGTTTAGTATYGQQTGRYTKIGNRVLFKIFVNYNSHTGTGNIEIAGLPFTVSNAGSAGNVQVTAGNNLTFTGDYLVSFATPNTTKIALYGITSGASETATAMDVAATIYVSGQYEV
jgi:hypothetical protein